MNNVPTTNLKYQSNWECLGSISAISQYGETESFMLFVKVIGEKEFYKVEPQIQSISYSLSYSVTKGKYSFKGKNYNAKFSVHRTDYYFNL